MGIFKRLSFSFSLLGLCMMGATSCEADTSQLANGPSKLIPRHLLFGNPEKTSPKISPDGSRLAYLAPDSENVLNVWVRGLNETADKVQKVTEDPKRGIRQFLWQFDNAHILYIQDQDGDENWHLYQTSIQTKETKDLTPYSGVRVELLDYDSRYPDEILIQMNKRNTGAFDVYRVNLKTGKLELDTENFGGVFRWLADHQLKVRAAQSYSKEGATQIFVRDQVDAPWRKILSIDPEESECDLVSFSPDNQSLYLISSLDGQTSRLLKIDLETGKREVVVEDKSYDLSDIMINPTTHTLEAAGVERELPEWIVLDNRLGAAFDQLRQLSKGPFQVVSRDLADRHWVVASLSDQRPTHFYIYRRPEGQWHFLFSTQPALEQYRLNPMKPISFTARDGMTLYGYLTLPEGGEARRLPTILLVHGGPWVRDSWGMMPAVQWLANRGYAVLQVNYRGSTGYGKSYLNAGNREWGGKMHTDLLDGKQWMISQGYTDPNKVAIYGGSYGGYATLVGLTFTPEEFCCGVDIVGPSNLITLLETIPPYWAPFKAQTDLRLGNLDTDREFLKERSPLFKVDQIKSPLLIAQGANDPRVKQAESDQIVAALRKNQLAVEYLLFSDEGHGFARPENRAKFFAAAEEFLSKYLGGRHEKPSAAENWESLKK